MHFGEFLKTRIVFFADRYTLVDNVREHIAAICTVPGTTVRVIDPFSDLWNSKDLQNSDGVIIHYSAGVIWNNIWNLKKTALIAEFSGIKIVFAQDEYRQVNRFQEKCAVMGINHIFTSVKPCDWKTHYPYLSDHGTTFSHVLPGYSTSRLLNLPFTYPSTKPKNVRYRSRQTPFYLGRHGQMKDLIDKELKSLSNTRNWVIDSSVDEEKRLFGRNWHNFLALARVSPTVEGGSSTWDFSGALEQKSWLAQNEGLSFSQYFDMTLRHVDGTLEYKTSSPRIFESASVGSVILALEGHYDGLLHNRLNCLMIDRLDSLEKALIELEDEALCDFLAENARLTLINQETFTYAFIQNEILKLFNLSGVNFSNTKPNVFSESNLKFDKSEWYLENYEAGVNSDKSFVKQLALIKARSSRLIILRVIYLFFPIRIKRRIDFFLKFYFPGIMQTITKYLH